MKINNKEYKTIIDSLNTFIDINNFKIRKVYDEAKKKEIENAVSLKKKIESLHEKTFSGIDFNLERLNG